MKKVKKKPPLVTVIMNCYNGEKYLNKSLKSLINQKFKNWELIFWNNKSTDGSKKIFKRFKDKRFRYFENKKFTNLYRSRNYAIKKAKGKYVSFLDTDDWWKKTKLDIQLKYFKKNPKIDLIYSNFFIYDEKKKNKYLFSKKELRSGFITKYLLEDYRIFILTVLAKKKLFIKSGFSKRYDIIGDFDFFVRSSEKFYFESIQKPLAFYRHHNDNYSKLRLDKYNQELNFWYNKFKRKYKKKDFRMTHVKKEIFKSKVKLFLNKVSLGRVVQW